jgi:hypothetical protein
VSDPQVVFERYGPVRVALAVPPLPLMTEASGRAWRQWLDQHGLDPCVIPLGTPIVCHDDARVITVTEYVEDDAGRRVLDQATGWVRTQARVVRLEAPALPMPGEPALDGDA